MGIFSLPLAFQYNLYHHLDFKKCSKNISNNYIIFQKVGNNFSYENKLHQSKSLY
jgi:hypothetical protein